MVPEKKKVLVVEDSKDLAEMLQLLLKGLGLASAVATNGPQGLEKALNEKPDLILLDIMLPQMGGLEVARRLKADPLTQGIPILAITAKVMPGDQKVCLENGCDGYMAKPFFLPDLKAEIERLLKARSI